MSDAPDDKSDPAEQDTDEQKTGDELSDEEKQSMEKEREERLDPDNRPDNAEIDNTDRTFDARSGQFTDDDEDDGLGPFADEDPEAETKSDDESDDRSADESGRED
jgi:hypothetical protein